ncbi:hypothetical protein EPUS_01972 [Endocarpon pusillum Z07020]|uniref:Box C/D snoRNA protein 1 n=1 Tax=Endocarpon pusillum (strain Z07020 / HMAS-L-300199) TaxID=1263415 RepID=U1HUH4_ENDPU|nr:uncharacterized protein EPUS_01972 [Endocarpon pusillum Z07020]ERF74285.1 hypothetical protein EPUS_01972 [Endocarpon pusillum Z07020]
MTEDALLNELCAICHINRPKYKCPRCTIQTCSLACVKRHKLWSQCSGTRDPAAYRKRHQLATPSSFDQDFNFITRVERTIERAGDEAQERGIALSEERRKRVKGEARRDVEIGQRGAIVLRAPPGMSRALQNKSKWDNRHKCLLWTVEWILENGSRVFGNCQETRTITEAFTNAVGRRKVQSQQAPASTATLKAQDVNLVGHEKSTSSTGHHFYLHRPNLPSNVRCVIPLQPDAVIKDVIQDRVLNEFPTIFVLGASKEKLQKPFITEEEYMEKRGSGPPTIVPGGPMAGRTADDRGEGLDGLRSAQELNERQIKEVLQKDLGT